MQLKFLVMRKIKYLSFLFCVRPNKKPPLKIVYVVSSLDSSIFFLPDLWINVTDRRKNKILPTYPHFLDWVAEWNNLNSVDLLQIGTNTNSFCHNFKGVFL